MAQCRLPVKAGRVLFAVVCLDNGCVCCKYGRFEDLNASKASPAVSVEDSLITFFDP